MCHKGLTLATEGGYNVARMDSCSNCRPSRRVMSPLWVVGMSRMSLPWLDELPLVPLLAVEDWYLSWVCMCLFYVVALSYAISHDDSVSEREKINVKDSLSLSLTHKQLNFTVKLEHNLLETTLERDSRWDEA
jgi:hypothetical protein